MTYQFYLDYPSECKSYIWLDCKIFEIELHNRGVYIRSNATKLDLVKEVVNIFGSEFMSRQRSPMSVDSPLQTIN
ncbi:MAG: hypothetical protein ACKPKO_24760 [Candidatus Fonsibacter sp.]